MKGRCTLVLFGTLAIAPAHAFEFNLRESRIRAGIAVGSMNFSETNVDVNSTGWVLTTGFELNRYVAAELGWWDGGKAYGNSKLSATQTQTVNIESQGWQLSALGSYPFKERYSVFGRVGFLSWRSASRIQLNGVDVAVSRADGNDLFYGAGVALHVEDALLRLEYDVATVDEFDVSYLSLAAVWNFEF